MCYERITRNTIIDCVVRKFSKLKPVGCTKSSWAKSRGEEGAPGRLSTKALSKKRVWLFPDQWSLNREHGREIGNEAGKGECRVAGVWILPSCNENPLKNSQQCSFRIWFIVFKSSVWLLCAEWLSGVQELEERDQLGNFTYSHPRQKIVARTKMATVEPGERWTDCIHFRKIITFNDEFDIGEARK